MNIFLQNTLTKNKELFKPLKESEISMYSCGPTVYNYLHIGNLRAYVFADILKRVLQYNGYKVNHVMNITDIGHLTSDADDGEDKMVKGLKREGLDMSLESLKKLATKYADAFKKDFEEINIIPADKLVFASDEIPEQIKLIEELTDKGFVYKTSDGIYFDTEKLPTYGRLGGSASTEHSRIGVNNEKKNPKDFAVWKFADKDGIGFEAPFGKGFPGWHIECSAMSMKYLGEQFDIHTGGIDHIQVHHNNEIAQSEALTGKILANYWMHNNHLTIGEDKMAKSGENFLTLSVLKEKGISPLAYRYWLLQSRYSTRMNFSWEALEGAQTGLERLKNTLSKIPDGGIIDIAYKDRFIEAINDDLDTPRALVIIRTLLEFPIRDEDKKATILDFDRVLGLGLADIKKEEFETPSEIQKLLDERKTAKENKDFQKADEIREKIKSLGFEVLDTSEGQQIKKL